nr:polycystic kidney disease 2-like 2 protein [Parasteatoda tepidariorum]
MAIVISCLCQSFAYEEDDADEDEEDPRLQADEEYLHDIKSKTRRNISYKPMDFNALEEARKEREKEVKMYSVLKEIVAYILFFWVIMILSYGNRDPNNFYLREALVNGFIKPGDLYLEFNNVNTEKRFWNWTHNALIPELFAQKWYNGRDPLGLRLYLDDRNNMKIGYAVLRQVRIQPKSCDVSFVMETVTPECAGYGKVAFEDGTLYTTNWIKVNSTETPVPNEYKYLTAAQLKGYPFWGQLDWYGGGGYVVALVTRKRSNSDLPQLQEKLKKLEKEGWVDRHTRAVFVEFGIYNAQVNLFCSVTIVAEFLPGGGVIPYYQISPIRLLNYHSGFGMIQLSAEIIFVICTIFFTVKEVASLSREGLAYFHQYWNVVEVISIVVSYTGIANHVYKIFVTAGIIRIFTETEGSGYVKLQEAVLLDELYSYQIGIVMSISTLKFLKLLRFNKRIGILSGTLRECAKELQSYSVCLMVVFFAFVALFWLLLGRYIREFSTLIYALESTISLMLKKFDYEEMYAAQPILTPIAFFAFSLATSVVLINIMLSIIIQSFERAKHDVANQGNEYEILDFFIGKVKSWVGAGNAKVKPAPQMYQDKKIAPDTVAAFPAKVDRLVEFINDFYFDGHMDFNSKDLLKKVNVRDDSAKEGSKKSRPTKITNSKIPRHISKELYDF